MARGSMTVQNKRSNFDRFTVNMVSWKLKSIISDCYNRRTVNFHTKHGEHEMTETKRPAQLQVFNGYYGLDFVLVHSCTFEF